MAEFLYNALDGKGEFVAGRLQAQSSAAASQQLVELGYVPLSVAPEGTKPRNVFVSLFPEPKVSARDVTVLLQDLALMLRSGLPLDEGLRLLTEDASPGTVRLIARLRSAIGSGANFAEALQSHPATALPDLIAVVRSAEATGNLEGALETIALERLKQEKITGQIRAALRYPIFLMMVSLLVLLFFLLFVVPQFADVIRDFGSPPDALVATVIAVSDGLRRHGDVIAAVGVAFAGAIAFAARSSGVRRRMLAPLFGLPGLRGVVVTRRTASFCRSLGTLLANGVVLTDAMRLMSESGVAGDRLAEVCDRVRQGARLYDSLAETSILPALAARMLRVGEESGALDVVAIRCASYYEAKLTERIEKLTAIVGPAAIIFIAGVIGTLIVSIMSTLLSIDQMIT
jgi:general secretion pathway protein F